MWFSNTVARLLQAQSRKMAGSNPSYNTSFVKMRPALSSSPENMKDGLTGKFKIVVAVDILCQLKD